MATADGSEREGSAKSFEKREKRVRAQGGEKRRKNQEETYPVEIPRFVRRQFEFYYSRITIFSRRR